MSPQLAEFQRFASQLKTENGEQLRLYPEQSKILEPYFDGCTETVVLLPKKNGKSSLIGALGLHHLLTTPFADCIIVASSRDQAKIVLDQMKMFIRQSPALRARMKVKDREITYDGGRVRVLASDQDTADGQLPTLAVVDELHRQKSGELRGVLRLGLGPRQGRMLVISTAGASFASPLGLIRTKAYSAPGFVRDKEARTSTLIGKTFSFFEWCLNTEDDQDDLEIVKRVNPAPWKTLETLAEDKEAISEYEYLRLMCGIWTEGAEPWLPAAQWDALPASTPPTPGAEVMLGIRVGQGHRTAALVWVQDLEGMYQVGYEFINGEAVLSETEDAVRRLNKEYRVGFNCYVSRTFDRSAEILSDEGLMMVPYPIGTRTAEMAETLLRVIGEKRLAQPGHGPFRQSVLAGQVKTAESGWRFVDSPEITTPTDALFALAAAVHTAETQKPVTPMFAWT